MKKLLALVIICFVAGAFGVAVAFAEPSQPAAQNRRQRDRVKATRVVRGTFRGYEMGDYMHALITKEEGGEASFFLNQSDSLRYFLVAHKGKMLELTYQVVDSYIPEAGGFQTIERLISARDGRLSDGQWWRRESARLKPGPARRKYDAMVDKAIVNSNQ